MLKYVDTLISFSEVPDEISLCINISNCPCHCKGCHSSYLAQDIGKDLNTLAIKNLIENNDGITCVCIMGGDNNPIDVDLIAQYIRFYYPKLKIAWYSGRQEFNSDISIYHFDYIKLGPYIEERGPLNNKNTNQRMYKILLSRYEDGTSGYELEDITYKFWK